MMRKTLVMAIVMLSAVGPAQAKMVHYFDAQGKIHYVNTDYASVPERYRAQIKDQLEADAPAPVSREPLSSEATDAEFPDGIAPVMPVRAKEFAAADCRLTLIILVDDEESEKNIRKQVAARNLAFVVYDVRSEPGKSYYNNLGGGALPMVQIMAATVLQGAEARNVGKFIDGMPSCEKRPAKKR